MIPHILVAFYHTHAENYKLFSWKTEFCLENRPELLITCKINFGKANQDLPIKFMESEKTNHLCVIDCIDCMNVNLQNKNKKKKILKITQTY